MKQLKAGKDRGISRAGEGFLRVGYGRLSSSALHSRSSEMDF